MKSFEVDSRSWVRYFIANQSLYECIFAYAMYTIFFRMQGMNDIEIAFLLSFWSFSSLMLEIPTGAWSDRWDRRKILILSPLIKSLCFITWALAGNNFWFFALGFFFWSLGSTLRSGTAEAYLFDMLKHKHDTDSYERIMGQKDFFSEISKAIATVSGGFLAFYHPHIALYASVVPLILSSVVAYKLPFLQSVSHQIQVSYLEHIQVAFSTLKKNPKLIAIIFAFVVISLAGELDEFDQLYYATLHLPLWSFGVVMGIGYVLNSFSALIIYRIKDIPYIQETLFTLTGMCLVIVGTLAHAIALIALFLAYGCAVILHTFYDARLQRSIHSSSRATITSSVYFCIGVIGIAILPIFGWVSHIWGVPMIYALSGICFLLYVCFILLRREV